HQRAASHAVARHSRLRYRRGHDGRLDDLGTQSRTDAVHRAKGFCLGSDRLDVSRQRRRGGPGAAHGAGLRGIDARAVLYHRAADRHHLHRRRLLGFQFLSRRGVDDGIWRVGISVQEASYPLAPLVLAIVIGDKAEDAFRQSMLMSRGSLGIFFANRLVTSLVLAGIALLLLPLVLQLARLLRKPASPAAETPSQEKVII